MLRRWFGRRDPGNAPSDGPALLAEFPWADGLDADERRRLCRRAEEFLRAKDISAAAGHAIDDAQRWQIALQAALPVLNLDIGWYRNFHQVIVYPTGFRVEREVTDMAGVVHEVDEEFSGEAWEQGPVLLAWDDVAPGAEPFGEGTNVVMHEMAHKLDMLDPTSTGRPPLHAGMSADTWARDFTAAYDQLCRDVDAGIETWIDPYAAEAPEEFFAVLSEHFFIAPCATRAEAPAVYAQLAAFYRQDPAARCPHCGAPA